MYEVLPHVAFLSKLFFCEKDNWNDFILSHVKFCLEHGVKTQAELTGLHQSKKLSKLKFSQEHVKISETCQTNELEPVLTWFFSSKL